MSNRQPSVSVIVPTFNRPLVLKDCLASLTRQVYTNFEVIVVNDGGVPVTVDPELASRLELRIIHTEHRGLASARNVGIQNASGELLAFLDDDDIFFPEHLSRTATRVLLENADLVYSTTLVSKSRVRNPVDLRELAVASPLNDVAYFDFEFSPDFLVVANYIPVTATVCKNFKNERLFFDESMAACEDWDLWLRLCFDLGFRFHHVSDVTCVYHKTGPSMTNDAAFSQKHHDVFAAAYEKVVKKWATADSYIELYRCYVRLFYALRRAAVMTPSDQLVSLYNWENLLHLLHPAFRSRHFIEDSSEHLLAALTDGSF